MAYPLKMSKKRTGSSGGPRPGTYDADVISITDAPGYKPGSAFVVTYSLTDGERTWTYNETFINDLAEPRTKEFIDYLEKNGIPTDNIDGFVGCHQELILLKEYVPGRGTFLNVDGRKFVSKV